MSWPMSADFLQTRTSRTDSSQEKQPMQPSHVSRRNFIKTAAAGAAVASTLAVPAPARAIGANDRIRVGFIGPGGRGFGAHVKTLAGLHNKGFNVDLVAVSEVYKVQE